MSLLRAALVTPLSGSLARFGRGTATALRLWANRAAKLPRPWSAVELEIYDAHPDPAGAMRTAAAEGAHLLFGPYGTNMAVSAIGATERVVWNHGAATSRLSRPRFANVLNVLSPGSSYYEGVLHAVREADPEVRAVSLLHASTGFAREVAHGADVTAAALGFEVRSLAFRPGTADRAASRLPDGEILLVAGGFEDELVAARALLSRPWRAAAFVGAGEQDVLASLEARRERLLGPAQWVPTSAIEPEEGPDGRWFIAAFRDVTGVDPPYPAAQAFAAGVLACRCLRNSGAVDDVSQLAAGLRLTCRTFYGDFRLDAVTGIQVGHQVLTVQWQSARRVVVWPPRYAEQPIVYPRAKCPWF